MNPQNKDQNTSPIRPTKKQRELLAYINEFIEKHGYSPSYREIMKGLNYTSVATVALHVNSLIKRGHLKKRDRSARSLEVVLDNPNPVLLSNEVKPEQERWLVEKVEHAFREVESSAVHSSQEIENLHVLVGALRVLGLEGASQGFIIRLKQLAENSSS